MNIQKRTIKRLRTVASKVFGDDEQYYQFIGTNYQVDSTLDLTEEQAEEAISILDRELKARKRAEHGRRDPKMISQNQKEYIEGLFKELGWAEGPRWWGFIAKQTGKKSTLNMLTRRDASKVIVGLERMVAWEPMDEEAK